MAARTIVFEVSGVLSKYCSRCNIVKPMEDFSIHRSNTCGRRSACKQCINTQRLLPENRTKEALTHSQNYYKKYKYKWEQYRDNNIHQYLYNGARTRARNKNQEFTIDVEDIIIPERCPLLGIKMQINKKTNRRSSYSLDRIDPNKGYIKGNVWVISYRANMLKSNASLEELQLIVRNLKKFLNSRE